MASFTWPSQGAGGGVTSFNTLTGAVVLSAGTGITLSPSGNTITISSSPGTTGNLTSSPTTNLVVTGGTGAVFGSGTLLTLTGASLVEATSSVLTIMGASNAVLGSGVSIQVKQASTSQSGYLSSTDWTTFNGKQASGSYITALTGDVIASGPGSGASQVAAIQGKTVSGTTGTGNVVFSASPILSGTLSGSASNGAIPIKGTNTNDSAASGNIGEYVVSTVSSGAPVSLTNNTATNVTSIALSAGDWDVTGIIGITGTPTGTGWSAGISTTSVTFGNLGDTATQTPTLPNSLFDTAQTIPSVRITLASSGTAFLLVKANFTVGTISAYGRISARRPR